MMARFACIAWLLALAAAVGCRSQGGRAVSADPAAAATASPAEQPAPPTEAGASAAESSSAKPAAVAPPSAEPSTGQASPTATHQTTRAATQPPWIQLTPLIRADREARVVELRATAVLDVGFLEQYVCLAGTREHEALFAFEGKASEVHAALLLIGLEQGEPGRWREVTRDDGSFAVEGVAPRGGEVRVAVVLEGRGPLPLEHFVRASPVVPAPEGARPPTRFVFAGSRMYRNPRTGSERYVADGTGSLIGLVTFGDETIAALDVIPDQASAVTPLWEVFTERMPKPGTSVTIRLSAGE